MKCGLGVVEGGDYDLTVQHWEIFCHIGWTLKLLRMRCYHYQHYQPPYCLVLYNAHVRDRDIQVNYRRYWSLSDIFKKPLNSDLHIKPVDIHLYQKQRMFLGYSTRWCLLIFNLQDHHWWYLLFVSIGKQHYMVSTICQLIYNYNFKSIASFCKVSSAVYQLRSRKLGMSADLLYWLALSHSQQTQVTWCQSISFLLFDEIRNTNCQVAVQRHISTQSVTHVTCHAPCAWLSW